MLRTIQAALAAVLNEAGIKHRRTRPYRPQTNGKVERFNRILKEEWAYAKANGVWVRPVFICEWFFRTGRRR